MTSVLLLITSIILNGCANTAGTSTNPGVATESGPEEFLTLDPKDVAIAVEEKLKKTVYMRQRVVVQAPDDVVIEIKSHMGKDRFRTEVYEKDILIEAYSLLDGRIQEYKPTLERRPFIEYDSPRADGTDDAVFNHPFGCYSGAHLATWLGNEPNHRQSFFRRHISDATLLGMEDVQGRPCLVLSHTWEVGERELNHTFCIDPSSWLVLAWTSSVDGETRNRSYFDIVTARELPVDVDWSLRPLAVSQSDRTNAE